MDFDPIAYINEPRWQKVSLGLERTRLLLELLGRPQDALRFVHVAGTNGKGSVCAYAAAALQEAGYRTGLFTSPYIERFEDRIRVDGANIPRGALLDATRAVRDAAAEVEARLGEHPTEFELMCAVALVHFAHEACDIAVLEVGLGGRLDSTNAIDAPEVAVIARIGLDHTAILGDTLADVAGEKAGIIKAGAAVVSWPQEAPAAAVVERAAAACGAAVREPDFAQLQVGAVERDADGALVRRFAYRGRGYRTGLLGSYQPANAALAIEVLAALRGRGWRIPDEAIARGIAKAAWPGRFEVVGAPVRGAGAGAGAVVVDGGHNPQGARALADSLRDVFPGARPVFVCGVLADKDHRAMLREVLPLAGAFVAVAPESPRALPAAELAAEAELLAAELAQSGPAAQPESRLHVEAAPSIPEALARARELAGPDGLVCAFGSLYSVGAVKRALMPAEANSPYE